MKYRLFFSVALIFSAFSYSQEVKVNPSGNKKFDTERNIKTNPQDQLNTHGNNLKVSLIKDSLFVTDKNQLVPVADINALDSLIKKLPQPETLNIHFEARDANPEKIRSVDAVLKKCRCPITRHGMSFNNNNTLPASKN